MTASRMTDERWSRLFLARRALTRGEQAEAVDEAARARHAEAALSRLLAAEVADPENPGHIRACSAKGGASASCSSKCLEIAPLLTVAGTGL